MNYNAQIPIEQMPVAGKLKKKEQAEGISLNGAFEQYQKEYRTQLLQYEKKRGSLNTLDIKGSYPESNVNQDFNQFKIAGVSSGNTQSKYQSNIFGQQNTLQTIKTGSQNTYNLNNYKEQNFDFLKNQRIPLDFKQQYQNNFQKDDIKEMNIEQKIQEDKLFQLNQQNKNTIQRNPQFVSIAKDSYIYNPELLNLSKPYDKQQLIYNRNKNFGQGLQGLAGIILDQNRKTEQSGYQQDFSSIKDFQQMIRNYRNKNDILSKEQQNYDNKSTKELNGQEYKEQPQINMQNLKKLQNEYEQNNQNDLQNNIDNYQNFIQEENINPTININQQNQNQIFNNRNIGLSPLASKGADIIHNQFLQNSQIERDVNHNSRNQQSGLSSYSNPLKQQYKAPGLYENVQNPQIPAEFASYPGNFTQIGNHNINKYILPSKRRLMHQGNVLDQIKNREGQEANYLIPKQRFDAMQNNIDQGYRLGQSINDKDYHIKANRNSGFNLVNNSTLPA